MTTSKKKKEHSDVPLFVFGDTLKRTDHAYLSDNIIPLDDAKAVLKSTPKFEMLFAIGDNYWNGSGWQKNECSFEIELPSENGNNANCWLSVKDTNVYTNYVDDLEGYLIKIPSNIILTGKIKLSIKPAKNTSSLYSNIRNFKLTYQTPNKESITGLEDKKTDKLYSQIINQNNIKELDTIDLKLCSNTDNELSLASVLYKHSTYNTYVYLTSLFRYSNDDSILPEEYLLDSLFTQYSTPAINISVECDNIIPLYSKVIDGNFNNKIFSIESIEYNLYNATSRLNITEKKINQNLSYNSNIKEIPAKSRSKYQ